MNGRWWQRVEMRWLVGVWAPWVLFCCDAPIERGSLMTSWRKPRRSSAFTPRFVCSGRNRLILLLPQQWIVVMGLTRILSEAEVDFFRPLRSGCLHPKKCGCVRLVMEGRSVLLLLLPSAPLGALRWDVLPTAEERWTNYYNAASVWDTALMRFSSKCIHTCSVFGLKPTNLDNSKGFSVSGTRRNTSPLQTNSIQLHFPNIKWALTVKVKGRNTWKASSCLAMTGKSN